MPKVNPWSLERKVPAAETRTFPDPEYPGVEYTFTCRPLDGCEALLMLERSQEYIEEWVEGKDGEAPTFPLGGGEAVITASLCRTAALIETMQCGPEAERYLFADLVGIAFNSSEAWLSLQEWIGQLSSRRSNAEGNSPSADGSSSSARPPRRGKRTP